MLLCMVALAVASCAAPSGGPAAGGPDEPASAAARPVPNPPAGPRSPTPVPGEDPTAAASADAPAAGPTTDGRTTPDPPATASVPPLLPRVDAYAPVLLDVGPARVAVRVAATAAQRRRGLMDVPHLPDGTGMLFLFPTAQPLSFWMRDTLVPLDLAAVDASGRVRAVLPMDPCPAGEDCPRYQPPGRAIAALETPQGWLRAAGVRVGDRVCGRADPERSLPAVLRCGAAASTS